MLIGALKFRQLGLSPVPCLPGSKRFDKHAMANRGYKLADLKEQLPTIDDLRFWFENSDRNVAVLTSSKFIAVDFDLSDAHVKFRKEYPTLIYTMTQRTSRGKHLFYELSQHISKPLKITWPDIEVKHSGQAIMVSPSIHPSGHKYEIIENGLLDKFTVLRLSNVFVLPFVEEKRPGEGKGDAGDTFSFTRPKRHSSIITQIKLALPLTNYIKNVLGFELITSGDKFCCRCPVHQGKSQTSFWVDPKSNRCNCFDDRCRSHKPMDVLDLHCRLHDVSLKRSIFELKTMIGIQ